MLLPQDVLPLMLLLKRDDEGKLNQKLLAQQMGWAPSAVHRSLGRLTQSQLWSSSRQQVRKRSAEEFLRYGLRYSFPPVEKGLARGFIVGKLPNVFLPATPYVWASDNFSDLGTSIEPLDKGFLFIAERDPVLTEWLQIVEVFRLGRIRELNMAIKILRDNL